MGVDTESKEDGATPTAVSSPVVKSLFVNHGETSAEVGLTPGSKEEQVQHWIRICGDILGLKDWDIVYDPSIKVKRGNLAETRFQEGTHATIVLSRKFFSQSPELQRLTITHELFHVICYPLQHHDDLVRAAVTNKMFEVLHTSLVGAEEHIVENLARLFANNLPLPTK